MIAVMVILILLCLSGAVYVTIGAIVQLKRILLFRREGKTVTGTISNLRLERGSGSTRHSSSTVKYYYATFNYSLNEKIYEQTVPISGKHYNLWRKDMPITVMYAVSRPEIAQLAGDSSANRLPATYIFFSIVLVFLAIAFSVILIEAH